MSEAAESISSASSPGREHRERRGHPPANAGISTALVRAVLCFGIMLMAAGSVRRLGVEYWRLIGPPEQDGVQPGFDAACRYEEVARWFSGTSVYTPATPRAIHLPASYVLMWPLFGWLSTSASQYLVTLVSSLLMVGLAYVLARESLAGALPEHAFIVLMPLSLAATGLTIHLGQTTFFVLTPLVVAVLASRGPRRSLLKDVLVALLLLVALVKPHITAPFLLLLVASSTGIRPAVLAAAGYLALSQVAASFQPVGLIELLRQWAVRAGAVMLEVYQLPEYYTPNVACWLVLAGLRSWIPIVSVCFLAALGAWLVSNQRADLWHRLAVTAIVCRLYTYHMSYDDVLLLLPAVALFRIIKLGGAAHERTLAGTLLALLLGGVISLYTFRYFHTIAAAVWVVILVYLALRVRRSAAVGEAPGAGQA